MLGIIDAWVIYFTAYPFLNTDRNVLEGTGTAFNFFFAASLGVEYNEGEPWWRP